MSEESLISSAAAEADAATEQQQQAAVQDDLAPAIERPEWLLDRYMQGDRGVEEAIKEQAKGYNELRKQLGGFTGAPEDNYEFSLPEGIEGNVDTELDAYKQFTELAKDVNMSQDTAQKLFNIFVGYQDSMMKQVGMDAQQQKQMLGENADQRLSKLSGWASNNLPAEHMPAFASMLTTAQQVEAMEALLSKTHSTQMHQTSVTASTPAFTKADFERAVQSERYQKDAEYRKEVLKKAEAILM